MRRYQNRAGLIVAASIPLLVLPARISEGQWKDPVNLIGSEIVIFLMSLACWHLIIYLQKSTRLKQWHKIVLSLLGCCLLSNLFFFTFNPIFKDFPFRTAVNPLYIRILMLCSRGILMSIILIPSAFYIHKELEARRARRKHQKLALKKVKVENKLLEHEVSERTKALHYALIEMQKTQKELEHQIYIQSRLLASFNHDIRGPFTFSVVIADKIVKLAALEGEQSPIYRYAYELNGSLKNVFSFVKNILEFTRLPIEQKLDKSDRINLGNLIEEKARLFEGSMKLKHNNLLIHVDPAVYVASNYNLLGIVLHNLIDNANKYTDKGVIEINSGHSDQGTELHILNPKANIPAKIIEWVNAETSFSTPEDSDKPDEIYGIGLLLVKELSDLLNIKLSMYSNHTGTHVKLTFLSDAG